MKYILLLYDDETRWADQEPTPELFEPWIKYSAKLQAAGAFVAGDALLPTPTATTVRVRDEKTVTTDGPFAETKEQLGGFYIIECADLDEAIQWASEVPSAPEGSVEIRPIMDTPDVPG